MFLIKTLFLRNFLLISCLLSAALISNCYPYILREEIQQGNFVEEADYNKIELGMTEEQVRFLLGNPLLTDTFAPQRWDYIFTQQTSSESDYLEYKHFVVTFSQGKVSSFEQIQK